jgi:acyl-CoA synthetase (AMP-forming)/AMP-acid ligase II
LSDKSPRSIAVTLGCLATNRPFAWLNRRLSAKQIAQILTASDARHIVVDPAALISLKSRIRECSFLKRCEWLIVLDEHNAVPETVVERLLKTLENDGIAASLLAPSTGRYEMIPPPIPQSSCSCCLFTSGSTGHQKGVMISGEDLLARTVSECDLFELRSGDRLLSLMPFSFDVGLNQLLSSLISGSSLIIENSWLPGDILNAITTHRVTGASAVPAIWRDLLRAREKISRTDIGSLRYIAVSGGSLSVNEQESLQRLFPRTGIFKTYGQTETFRSTSLSPEELSTRPSSVGREISGTEVFVLDEDSQPCPAGTVGQIVHRGTGTMLGYVGSDDTEEKLRPLPSSLGGGFAVYTGDMGHRDADGYLYLSGRVDRMIKIRGNRIYPEEVATQLREAFPSVELEVVAAVNAEGEYTLRVVYASSQRITENELNDAARRSLPAYMQPESIVKLDSVPRLENGKVDFLELNRRVSTANSDSKAADK